MIRLNLGCGKDVRDGWENYDLFPSSKDVKFIDLNQLPLSFESGSVDYIFMKHVFEHLDVDRLVFMKEIHRVLKSGGIIEINVPRNHNRVIHTIPFFSSKYFDSICKGNGCLFEKVDFRFMSDYSFFGRLYGVFPLVEKLFPLMFNGSFVWVLKKNKLKLTRN